MLRTHRWALLASVPAALALVFAGSTVAFAAPVADSETEYTMELSSTTATVTAGHTTTTVISFHASTYLHHTRVSLSAGGLPAGATATFFPPTPRLSGRAALVLGTSSSTPAGLATITVTAITISSDPIGTSATFGLTVTD
jgi:aminopeptidase S